MSCGDECGKGAACGPLDMTNLDFSGLLQAIEAGSAKVCIMSAQALTLLHSLPLLYST